MKVLFPANKSRNKCVRLTQKAASSTFVEGSCGLDCVIRKNLPPIEKTLCDMTQRDLQQNCRKFSIQCTSIHSMWAGV